MRTAGATASRIQKYMAALVLHQESPMETAITAGTIAALEQAVRPRLVVALAGGIWF